MPWRFGSALASHNFRLKPSCAHSQGPFAMRFSTKTMEK